MFISPAIERALICPDCRVRYTPLVYSTRQPTEAQHFHKDSGGIYLYRRPAVDYPNNTYWGNTYWGQATVWLAEVIPEGRLISEDSTVARAERVSISRIRAICQDLRPKKRHDITEGLAGNSSNWPTQLFPLCQRDSGGRSRQPKFEFLTTPEGEVLFSPYRRQWAT